MSLAPLFHAFDADPLGCWIDVYCRGRKWFIVLGRKRSRLGTVYPVKIGEARRFLRHAHGDPKQLIESAKHADESGFPLGIPVSVALQLERAA